MRIINARGLFAITATTVLFLLLHWRSKGGALQWSQRETDQQSGRLRHILLPATSVNGNLCKGLATSLMLDYPDPTIVGIRELRPADDMGSSAHEQQRQEIIFKLIVVLEYLESLDPSADKDLALVMDAFDSWLLLRPEIVESRYQSLVQEADQRLANRGLLGKLNRGVPIASRIVFGVDQTCWPAKDNSRPYCGSVPLSPLHKQGDPEETEEGVPEHARWLNAGVYMGPVREIRLMIKAALRLSEFGYAEDYPLRWDDQGALGDVWGEQELSRSTAAGESISVAEEYQRMSEFLQEGGPTEHGITIDYDSRLVQNAHASMDFVTWMPYVEREKSTRLDNDVEFSRPPFDQISVRKAWRDVVGGVNTATKHAFPVFHMTVHKELRDDLWSRLWFHPYGPQLVNATLHKIVKWSKDPSMTERVGWDDMCSRYFDRLF